MLIDITLKLTPEIIASSPTAKELQGHIGTHFDVMDKDFPLDYSIRKGIVFDVSKAKGREIEIADIDISKVKKGMFVAFYSGYIETTPYTSKEYFKEHPQLANELINKLLEKEISIIALDFAGVRRGKEHTPNDQLCADRGVFIIENLCNLKPLLKTPSFTAYTFPLSLGATTGIPCRVMADV